jgi:UDP-glucuronate 4-epimerase
MIGSQRYLVTGAMGFIGSWVVRSLVREGQPVIALDASQDDHRLRLIMDDEALSQINMVRGDITDLSLVEKTIKDQGVTHIIHLAALQTPFCIANPTLGANVNVTGTVNIFEAARRSSIQTVVYASSIGVFGLSDEYPGGIATNDSQARPRTLYGVFKQANESTARVYWWDHQISSIGLRPDVVYGPGRDQGMTSSPTWAMLAAAVGKPYRISFGGRCGMNYVDDVARIFIQAARNSQKGAAVYNVSGRIAEMTDIVETIYKEAPDMRGKISFSPNHLPLPDGMDDAGLKDFLPDLPDTSLEEGIHQTIVHFRQALHDGRIRSDQIPE